MNRRAFIKGLGAFMILPGAGRIWKAQREVELIWSTTDSGVYQLLRHASEYPLMPYQIELQEIFDKIYAAREAAPVCEYRYISPEYLEAMEKSLKEDNPQYWKTYEKSAVLGR